ncbi:hypothetical protein I5Q34_18250 [Streptomyces sp. AV19]|uniref:HalD/BesD family halogenase n=1 Tax=Streptomyces sp. AV19 TaxID=2793068 RepID=UPI0018FE59BA|nr:hypothetical protein [Streptomyces sp. AV19]MBH1936190.1 hypothetical protein [Streptomyces sp. AV19]MDG4534622.1 hypothetical protein [Streptomyces sp. AV19]
METDPLLLIDQERYPLHDLTDASGPLVAAARKEFEAGGLTTLDGFLRPGTAGRIVAHALKDAESGSHRFAGTSDVFFRAVPGDERRTGVTYTKSDVPYDRIDPRSPVRVLYEWEPLLAFVSAVVGRPVFRSADPLGAAVVQIQRDGDQQDWHFDSSEFTVLLHAQGPEEGGALQYAVRCREQVLRDQEVLDRIMAGDPSIPVREVATVPGRLVLHAGNVSMHRVTPTAGSVPRVNATLTFNSRPGVMLSDHIRRMHFGRLR